MDNRPQQLISQLKLLPHPEGGYYREIYRSSSKIGHAGNERDALTSIYFLLENNGVSRWHVVDADEVWHYYEGNELELFVMPPDLSEVSVRRLGKVSGSCKPFHVIPAGWWQAARTTGEYTLCGCTVAPGFEFSGFRFLNVQEKKVVSTIMGALSDLL